MKLHLEKSMRIISDLIMFCHSLGAESYQMNLCHEAGAFYIEITCPIYYVEAQKLEELRECLDLPRQHEIEQNYWELSGDSELSSELTLVGMMLDSATVTHEDGVLSIQALRKL